MDPAFWHARWEAGQIGFHQPEFHVLLRRLWPRLSLRAGERVFVPLCGKSLDMLWLLEQGHRVLGVELSPLAVAAFFRDNGLSPSPRSEDGFECWGLDELELWCGDYFNLRPEHLAEVGAVYDRASLIALPPELRRRYAERLAALLPPATPVLLITLEYPQGQMAGPPFSVGEDEVRELFGAAFEVELLETASILDQEPRFRAKGLSDLLEKAWRLVRR
jgi:thiopurine S-methyltransferase